MSLFPTKANSILIVYANAVLPHSISLQTLESVCRRGSEVTKFFRIVDLNQSAKSNRSNLLEPPDAALLEDRFRVPIVERTDQTNIILRFTLDVARLTSAEDSTLFWRVIALVQAHATDTEYTGGKCSANACQLSPASLV
jgi:hypothetical protein